MTPVSQAVHLYSYIKKMTTHGALDARIALSYGGGGAWPSASFAVPYSRPLNNACVGRSSLRPALRTLQRTFDEVREDMVAKLGVENGLLYYSTYEELEDGSIEWALLAVDAHTGKTAWKMPTGTGRNMDNNWGPVTLGPDGTAYIGVLGGIVAVYDQE